MVVATTFSISLQFPYIASIRRSHMAYPREVQKSWSWCFEGGSDDSFTEAVCLRHKLRVLQLKPYRLDSHTCCNQVKELPFGPISWRWVWILFRHMSSHSWLFSFFTANGCVCYSYVKNGCVPSIINIAVRNASVPVLNQIFTTVLYNCEGCPSTHICWQSLLLAK